MSDTTPATSHHGRRWSDRAARLQGMRTWSFAVIALAFLLGGLNLCLINTATGPLVFSAFAIALVGIVGAVAGKSSIESLSLGDGVKGAWTNLTTSRKPGAGPVAPPPAPGGTP